MSIKQDLVWRDIELTQEIIEKIRAFLVASECSTPEMIEDFSYSMYKKIRQKEIKKGLSFENSHHCWPLPADTSEIMSMREYELTEKFDECVQVYNRIIYLGYLIVFLMEKGVDEVLIKKIKTERNELRIRRYQLLDRINDIKRHSLNWYYGELKYRNVHRTIVR